MYKFFVKDHWFQPYLCIDYYKNSGKIKCVYEFNLKNKKCELIKHNNGIGFSNCYQLIKNRNNIDNLVLFLRNDGYVEITKEEFQQIITDKINIMGKHILKKVNIKV